MNNAGKSNRANIYNSKSEAVFDNSIRRSLRFKIPGFGRILPLILLVISLALSFFVISVMDHIIDIHGPSPEGPGMFNTFIYSIVRLYPPAPVIFIFIFSLVIAGWIFISALITFLKIEPEKSVVISGVSFLSWLVILFYIPNKSHNIPNLGRILMTITLMLQLLILLSTILYFRMAGFAEKKN